MYRKQIAEEKIAKSESLKRHSGELKRIATSGNVGDAEHFYEWLIAADEKVIIDWLENS